MSASESCGNSLDFPRARFFAMVASLAFIMFSLLLPRLLIFAGDPTPVLQMRAGIVRDFVQELPIGREALFSSVCLLPFPAVAALPFAFAFPAADTVMAYLYGISLILAVGTGSLAVFLRGKGFDGAFPAALFFALGLALWLSRVNVDLPPCIMLMAMAMIFETAKENIHRAMAGFFHAFAALCHPLGVLVLILKLGHLLVSRVVNRHVPEKVAVGWIQGFCIVYVLGVYFAFNWITLGDPCYALRHGHHVSLTAKPSRRELAELSRTLHGRYANSVPLVSGHWGYLVREQIEESAGHHFINFRRDKIPDWEEHERILIVPTADNALAAFSDLTWRDDHELAGCLLIEKTRAWNIYRVGTAP